MEIPRQLSFILGLTTILSLAGVANAADRFPTPEERQQIEKSLRAADIRLGRKLNLTTGCGRSMTPGSKEIIASLISSLTLVHLKYEASARIVEQLACFLSLQASITSFIAKAASHARCHRRSCPQHTMISEKIIIPKVQRHRMSMARDLLVEGFYLVLEPRHRSALSSRPPRLSDPRLNGPYIRRIVNQLIGRRRRPRPR